MSTLETRKNTWSTPVERKPGGVPIVGESKSESGGSGEMPELDIGEEDDDDDDDDVEFEDPVDDEPPVVRIAACLAGVRVAIRVTVGDAIGDRVGVASGVGRNSDGSGGCGDETTRLIEVSL